MTRVPPRASSRKEGAFEGKAFLSPSTSIKTARFFLPKNPDPEIRVCRRVRMKKSINDGTAFTGSSFPLFILSRIRGPRVQRGSLPRGGNDFRGREGKRAKGKREGKENGHAERRRREILGWMKRWGEKRSKVREKEREESAVEMKNSPEPKVTTGSYLQIRENNEADSRVEGN